MYNWNDFCKGKLIIPIYREAYQMKNGWSCVYLDDLKKGKKGA